MVLVDAIHAQTVEHIKRTHPFGVTLCQIVVHGYHVYTVSGQCIEEYGQGSHQSLTFTGCHFRNLAFVQYHTAEQLYVVVYHVPYRIIATGYPVVLVDGLIASIRTKSLVAARWRSNSVAVTVISSFSEKRLAVSFTMEKAAGSTSSNAFS